MFSEQLAQKPAYWGLIAAGVCALPVLALWTLRLDFTAGAVVSALYVILGLVDGAALAWLPRRGRSFGPVTPPWLALLI
jgi:hypothetical protein